MRKARALLTVLSIVLLSSRIPAAQESVPKDVLKKYPEDRFLHRPGTGESPEEAFNNAATA